MVHKKINYWKLHKFWTNGCSFGNKLGNKIAIKSKSRKKERKKMNFENGPKGENNKAENNLWVTFLPLFIYLYLFILLLNWLVHCLLPLGLSPSFFGLKEAWDTTLPLHYFQQHNIEFQIIHLYDCPKTPQLCIYPCYPKCPRYTYRQS